MAAPKLHDPQQVLDAYRAHRASGGGSDRDFIYHQTLTPRVSETWLRRALALWRGRAAKGLDPVTSQPSDTAKSLLQELGEAPGPDAIQAIQAAQQPQGQAGQKADGLKAELQPAERDARRIRKAERIMDKLLSGGEVAKSVSPATRAMAIEVLEAAGKLGKPRANEKSGKASEFTTWPTSALTGLLLEVAPTALQTRHDPAPPVVVVPEDERDAARVEESVGLPATLTA